MNIIVGASGQVGSHIIKELHRKGHRARAIVRHDRKVQQLGVDFVVADLMDADQVANAFQGGSTAFIITPEDPTSKDIIGHTKQIIENYAKAIKSAGVKKIVGLSCIGAQVESGTGNIIMSRMLEQGFDGLDITRVFIRPSYFYSNWLAFLQPGEQHGVLPSFFPADLKFDMNSPIDVAARIVDVITYASSNETEIIEVAGPEKYSVRDVASVFSHLLGKKVYPQLIPTAKRTETLLHAGFSFDAAQNLSEMTQALIDGVARPEHPARLVRLTTTLKQYLQQKIKGALSKSN